MNEYGKIEFTHSIQVGHRLFLQPGKCQQIHGHSMHVRLALNVSFDQDGYAVNNDRLPLEFGAVKKEIRSYLDDFYDHHLLLNENDPWAGILLAADFSALPGLRKVPGDPSTENIALWIAQHTANEFRCTTSVTVQETDTNAVTRTAQPTPKGIERSMFVDDALPKGSDGVTTL
jgi:6-pyruvoyltetrahydropterin/6-carboxytetrahydropterin synthase